MCGIAGILTRTLGESGDRIAASMTAALAHRGPDDAGTAEIRLPDPWRLHLGHRRLSILDVSRNGHQPMGDPQTGSWITYNGEIYNHLQLRTALNHREFRSTSDTETLLHGWIENGPDFISRLRGIFAFAVYDGRRDALWLVRDRLGVKPLYWTLIDSETLLFASEVRALLASGLVARRLSPQGLFSYLSFGAVQAPWTMVDGVHSLLPGERLRVDLKQLDQRLEWQVQRYWWPEFVPRGAGPANRRAPHNGAARDAIETLRPVFDEAVRCRFLADVPIGVFLSGGIDSSAIVASAARQQLDPVAYTISFAEAEFDEADHAESVAKACGIECTRLPVTAASLLTDFDAALDCYDQPSADGLNTYTISKAARAAGLKVAISGLGGDETFAGYGTFRRLPAFEQWRSRLGVLAGWAPKLPPSWRRGHGRMSRALQMLADDATRLGAYQTLRRFYSPHEIQSLMLSPPVGAAPLPAAVAAQLADSASQLDAVNAVSLLELSLYMPNTLLRDTDQMSMASGLEVRVPLVDHLLVEGLGQLAGDWKLPPPGLPNKWLLVELVKESLPPRTVRRKKMGFVFPWNRWLRNEMRPAVERYLLDAAAVSAAGLDSAEVLTRWHAFQRQRGGVRYADLLSLLNLVHWCQENQVTAAWSLST